MAETAQNIINKLSALVAETDPSTSTPQLTRKIELKTRFLDWREKELSDKYFHRHILELESDLSNYEKVVLVKDLENKWSVNFDTEKKCYIYLHKLTKESQNYYPKDRLPHLISTKVHELE